jgi:hypothetical protein
MNPILQPKLVQPGLLSYEAWTFKHLHFLQGMKDYLERVLNTTAPWVTNGTVQVDRTAMFDAFFRYLYRTSANRWRSFTAVL